MPIHVLILLVGSNPLPNYVVVNYLLKEDRQDQVELPRPNYFFLVYSNDTEPFKVKLSNKIKIRGIKHDNIKGINLGDPRSGKEVQECITRKLDELLSNTNEISSIHLNYTGGTKIMAVHAYQAVQKFVYKHSINAFYTYLNSERHRLWEDIENKEYPEGGNMLEEVSVKIEDLFDLHNMKLINHEKSFSVKEYQILDLMKGKFTTPEEYIYSFVQAALPNNQNYQEVFLKKWKGIVNNLEKKIKEHRNNLSKNEIKTAYEALRLDFNKFLPPFDSLEEKKFVQLVRWLHGQWLEDYIWLQLKELSGELKSIEVLGSIRAKFAQQDKRDCEIDVIVLKGYQFYLFTCTTSWDISLVKQKAFEGIFRAEQLGGDHAKVISVSLMYEKPLRSSLNPSSTGSRKLTFTVEDLKKDISSFDAIKNKNFDAIGLETLMNRQTLKSKLRSIILI